MLLCWRFDSRFAETDRSNSGIRQSTSWSNLLEGLPEAVPVEATEARSSLSTSSSFSTASFWCFLIQRANLGSEACV